ncbi:hypothetical protein TSAR_016229 [Trichomalopsis sarcophagae]|uniref:Uncharacterized protein n=1 Tax=Trichomalopsis sarcophagae TaxID=543379 RepID=A0A232FIQ6_9HYME|nr:hypothetical protein TSAR_016229 [Trichomalopsis sarcophagae]
MLARATSKAIGEYAKLRHLSPALATPTVKRKDGGCQTSPIFRQNIPHNTREHELPSPPLPPAAKKRKTEGDTQGKTKGSQPQQQQQQQRGVSKPAKGTSESKAIVRPPRPDAIKVKASIGGSSYADILRKVKSAPELKTLGDRVTRIRRTRVGELLLELGRPGTKTPDLMTVVSSTLSGSAEVRLLTHQESITIKDMDESTTALVVAAAIAAKIGPNVMPPDSIKIRGTYSGTLAANIQLPTAAAKKLLQNLMGQLQSSTARRILAVL